MNKDFFKGITFGLIVSLFVLGVNVSYADTVRKTIDVVYNDIKIVVDSFEITPMDGNGKKVDPFVVAGTTYLPVRAVAQAMGKDVNWDRDTNTITIGDLNLGNIVQIDKLKAYQGANFITTKGSFMNRGEPIYVKNYLETTTEHTNAAYLLDGKYKLLSGYICTKDNDHNSPSSVSILGDGVILYQKTVAAGDKPVKVDVNIAGVDKLIISPDISLRTAVYDVSLTKVD